MSLFTFVFANVIYKCIQLKVGRLSFFVPSVLYIVPLASYSHCYQRTRLSSLSLLLCIEHFIFLIFKLLAVFKTLFILLALKVLFINMCLDILFFFSMGFIECFWFVTLQFSSSLENCYSSFIHIYFLLFYFLISFKDSNYMYIGPFGVVIQLTDPF